MTKAKKGKYIRGDIKKVNYTKEEFECLLKHNEGYFKNHIDKYEDYYNLDREELKGFGIGGQYNIPYLTAPLIKVMLGNITENPYRDGRLAKVEDRKSKKERLKNCRDDIKKKEKKLILEDGRGIDLDKILKYNELIIKDIENLPIDIKMNLKNNTTYEFNYILNEVMPLILDRFSILLSLLISQSSVSAGNEYIELINALDSWIRNFAIHSIDMEMYSNQISDIAEEFKNGDKSILLNIGRDGNFNSEINKSYIIDSILREEYYRNLNLAKNFNDKIKKYGLKEFLEFIGYEGDYGNIDKNKIKRCQILEWINYIDENGSKRDEKIIMGLEDELLNFKRKLKSMDETKNGKMIKVNFYKEIMKSIMKSISKDPIEYRERIIDDAVGFIEPRELGIMMSKYLKKGIKLNSYIQSVKNGTIDIDPTFNRDLELYATKLWEEFDGRDKKKEKQIEKLISKYYDTLRNKEEEISKIKDHLTRAVEEMIIPKLIDEINNL